MVAFNLKCWLNLKMLFSSSDENYIFCIYLHEVHMLQRKIKLLISQVVIQTLNQISFQMVYSWQLFFSNCFRVVD
jgi:hypothetical protein